MEIIFGNVVCTQASLSPFVGAYSPSLAGTKCNGRKLDLRLYKIRSESYCVLLQGLSTVLLGELVGYLNTSTGNSTSAVSNNIKGWGMLRGVLRRAVMGVLQSPSGDAASAEVAAVAEAAAAPVAARRAPGRMAGDLLIIHE